MNRSIGYMDFQIFKKIIDEVATFPRCILRIGGMGESALHPGLHDFMNYVGNKGLLVDFTTNGELFSKYSVDQIFEWPLDDLRISIDGMNEESYHRIRKGGNYAKLQDQVRYFHQVKESTNGGKPKLFIRNVLFPEYTRTQIESFKETWKDVADSIIFNTLHTFSTLKEYEDPIRCLDVYTTGRIRWDGNIPLCGYRFHHDKEEFIGSIRDQSLKEVWNSLRMKEVRRMHNRKDFQNIQFCKFCMPMQDWSNKRKNSIKFNAVRSPIRRIFSKLVPVE